MESGQTELFSDYEWTRVAEDLHLSPQQEALAHNLLSGRSDKQIAREMGIAVPTVRSHITRLFHKFGTSDRVELILHFVRCLQACRDTRMEMEGHSLFAELAAK